MKRVQKKRNTSKPNNTTRVKKQQNLKPLLTQLSLFHSQQQHHHLDPPPIFPPSLNNNNNTTHTNNINNNSNVNCNNNKFASAANHDADVANGSDDKDFILSQDFFCTPDYITPECQNFFNNLDGIKENISCPASPEKLKSTRSKRYRQAGTIAKSPDSMSDSQKIEELSGDILYMDEIKTEKATTANTLTKGPSYVPQSAVALRCRVMPPPCIKNPYIKDASEMDVDPFGSWRSKCSGYFPASVGADNVSRYRTDFQEIEQIGNGNFNRVFKVLKRIDGCMYAVKHSIRRLSQDTDRRKALMEVQALAALGFHENVVAYHTSWFENEQLYIQMELCDYSLSIHNSPCFLAEEEVLAALLQIARALQFIHERGIAHLDVKPDNIYVKNGIYKLGDFGCATLLDKSLPIEEGDARYMPQEILNENYDDLDKVDIFSLGASMYELLRGSSLPETGHQLLKGGKLPLLPSSSLQLQNLLKVMVDPDPTQRPSAKELVENPIFTRIFRTKNSRKPC